MAWWNSEKHKEILLWDCAKEISKDTAGKQDLPLGWYIYQDGDLWYGMRPTADKTTLERSLPRSEPEELRDWLGVPVPKSLRKGRQVPAATPSLEALVRQAKGSSSLVMAKQGQQEDTHSQQNIQETEEVLSGPPPVLEQPSGSAPESSRARSGRVRNNEVHVWLSDAELARLRRRVQRSGLNQSEFLRKAALNGKIVIEERDPVNVALLDELELIRAELGRQGGLLKMIIKPNEGQRQLAPEEWDQLIQTVRYMENTKKRLARLEEKF